MAVVVVGTETDGWGNPPLSGLVVWAPADEGSVSASGPATARAAISPARAAITPARTTLLRPRPLSPRPLSETEARLSRTDPPYASGCSIAGVSGAAT